MGAIQLQLNLNVGKEGTDSSATNPLSRAYDNLLTHGKAHLGHTLCYFNASGRDAQEVSDLRWLGVFVHSAGDRILLFPGFSIPVSWLEANLPSDSPRRRGFYLDHFTAEPARQRWHFTELGRADHVPAGRMPASDGGMLFWFGLSVEDEQSLLPVHKSTVVRHDCPDSDVQRRTGLLRELENSARSGYISSDLSTRSAFPHSFLHFTFMIGRKDALPYSGHERLVPAGSDYLKDPLPHQIPESNIVLHRHPLSRKWVIDISTVWLPGKLKVPIVFTSAATL
jgi:hypothetical protein